MERRFSAPSSDDQPSTESSGVVRGATIDRRTAEPVPIPSDMQKTLEVDSTELPSAAEPVAAPAPTPTAEPRRPKLQPKRKRRIRLKHILPAWSVSLIVHVMIFTALGAATFQGAGEIRPIDFDSALGGADRPIEELPLLDDPTDDRPDRIRDQIEIVPGPATEPLAADQRPDIGSVLTGAGATSDTPTVRASGPARGGPRAASWRSKG